MDGCSLVYPHQKQNKTKNLLWIHTFIKGSHVLRVRTFAFPKIMEMLWGEYWDALSKIWIDRHFSFTPLFYAMVCYRNIGRVLILFHRAHLRHSSPSRHQLYFSPDLAVWLPLGVLACFPPVYTLQVWFFWESRVKTEECKNAARKRLMKEREKQFQCQERQTKEQK